jgi:hypothetical protein
MHKHLSDNTPIRTSLDNLLKEDGDRFRSLIKDTIATFLPQLPCNQVGKRVEAAPRVRPTTCFVYRTEMDSVVLISDLGAI